MLFYECVRTDHLVLAITWLHFMLCQQKQEQQQHQRHHQAAETRKCFLS